MPSCTKWHVHTAPRIPPEFLRRHCSPSKKCFVTHLYVINEQCERSNPSKKCHFDHIPCYCLFFIAHTFKFNPFLNLFHKTEIKIQLSAQFALFQFCGKTNIDRSKFCYHAQYDMSLISLFYWHEWEGTRRSQYWPRGAPKHFDTAENEKA